MTLQVKGYAVAALLASFSALGAGNPERGAELFGACAACHSVRPGEHLTGPSLATIYGKRAGTVKGFVRYSKALRHADVTWNAKTLDEWLANPQEFIPGNLMTFRGIPDAKQREDLIAFLENPKAANQSAAGGMMAAPRLESLRDVEPQGQVRAIRYCRDSYFVTLGTGRTIPFWEFNLRFKTNGGAEGPTPGKPVILRAGMRGDRASIVFASPEEIGKTIQRSCE